LYDWFTHCQKMTLKVVGAVMSIPAQIGMFAGTNAHTCTLIRGSDCPVPFSFAGHLAVEPLGLGRTRNIAGTGSLVSGCSTASVSIRDDQSSLSVVSGSRLPTRACSCRSFAFCREGVPLRLSGVQSRWIGWLAANDKNCQARD
jgi:hypothetical protein